MNKSLATNLIALALIAGGYFSPWYSKQIFSAGIFALSGAVTNWLAVHMLFEKVPFVYGSGVIPLYFEDLKTGIKDLIMEQFFRDENVARFLDENASALTEGSRITGMLDMVDYDGAFDSIKQMVLSSGFGGLLRMFGGADTLEKQRPVFRVKVQEVIREQVTEPAFREKVRTKLNDPSVRSEVVQRLEKLIEDRLKELTPVMVKEMMQKMIRRHLGWLVVWGGVFGGLIGLGMSFLAV
jgi:uncharacterized membrane protein YheB (UPF0754 family)